jgi:arylsulfatase A-like enzyme
MIRCLALLLIVWPPSVLRAQVSRPNILFIMTDDHAAHAIGCYGSTINQTPHLDRIAREGMRLNNCLVTNSICTPSRATILTGKYSHLNGVPVFNRFDGSQQTVQKLLQNAGYYTAVVGKWHLTSDPTGFDHWIVVPGQGRYYDPVFIDPSGRKTIKGYATDVITDLAIECLDKRPPDRPFMLMMHHKAPHRAWQPDPRYRDIFAKKVIPEPPTLWDDYSTRCDAIKQCKQKIFTDMTRRDLKLDPPPGLSTEQQNEWLDVAPTEVEISDASGKRVLHGKELDQWKYQRYMKDYLACVQSVDDSTGRILDYLDAKGLLNNTIVIYTSDQGFFLGDHGLFDKRFMYEQSLRMPFVIRWPGVIAPGSTQDAMVLNVDFAPTFLDMSGAPIPADMQGRSILPLLKGTVPQDWRTSMYYRYYHDPNEHNCPAHYGVRTERHKLIHYWKLDQWELFDLGADPDELRNLHDDPAQRELIASLKQELNRLKRELKDEDQFAATQPASGQ